MYPVRVIRDFVSSLGNKIKGCKIKAISTSGGTFWVIQRTCLPQYFP